MKEVRVHKLVQAMGEAWCRKQLLANGRPPGDGEKSVTISYIRKRLSTAIVKGSLSVLLNRTSMMGDGAKMARERREWGRLEEKRARDERQAAWRAEVPGRAVIRRGHFWLG